MIRAQFFKRATSRLVWSRRDTNGWQDRSRSVELSCERETYPFSDCLLNHWLIGGGNHQRAAGLDRKPDIAYAMTFGITRGGIASVDVNGSTIDRQVIFKDLALNAKRLFVGALNRMPAKQPILVPSH